MPLEKKTEDLIHSYLHTLAIKIKNIESGKSTNGLVVEPDFIEPTILFGNYPMNHARGEANYYNKIRRGLQIALRYEVIPVDVYGDVLCRAPPEIKELFDKKDPRLG